MVWAERADYLGDKAEVEIPAQPKEPFTVATVRLTPILIEIVDGTGSALGASTRTVVGKKVSLAVRSKPAGHTLTDIEWVIPEERVKNYTQSTTQGVVFKLEAADLGKASVGFFWISGGSKTVRVVAKIAGRQREATASFEVGAPTGVVMTSKTAEVNIGRSTKSKLLLLRYGIDDTQPGIRWSFTATAPDAPGEIAGVQLAKIDRVEELRAGNTDNMSTHGKFYLDDQVPYGPPEKIAAGATSKWTDIDVPRMAIDHDMVVGRMNDEYRMFFMYRPQGSDSIWVTLGRLDWHCRAAARRTWPEGGAPTPWALEPGVDTKQDPSGSPTTELPIWSELWSSGG